MKSKSIEPADYKEIGFATSLFYYVGVRCQAANITLYWPHPHRQWEYGTALTALHNTYGSAPVSVLDIGCGSSALGPAILLRTRATVHEVDSDERLVAGRRDLAKRLCLPAERYKFTCCGVLDIPDTVQYDAVFSMSVIEHIPEKDQEAAWCKVASLVKPGGLLVLTVDFGPTSTEAWHSDSERETKFDPVTIMKKAELLKSLGFEFEIDPAFNGPEVHDYTFFRIVARKKPSSGL